MADEVALELDEAGQFRLALEEVDQTVDESNAALSRPAALTEGRPPRLTGVTLTNFKSFQYLSADLGAFNVLVGANNAGKSTLLQGISLIFALLKLHKQGDGLIQAGRLVPVTALPVANMRDMWFQRRTRQGRSTAVPVGLRADFSDGSHVAFAVRSVFGNANSRVESSNGMDGERLAALLSHPAVWVPSAVGIVRDEEYRTAARREGLVNAGRHNEVVRNLLLALSRENPAGYSRLQRILQERFNASLGEVAFSEDLDQFVTADYRGDGFSHDLYSAGAGFVQVVQLLAFILTRSPSVVLLDEPDAHLHSSLQRIIIEILEELTQELIVQVLVATHSKEIINFVDPTRLLLVRSGETRVELMGDQVTPITVLRGLGAIDNVDAYTLLRNKRCLFLEGVDDEVIVSRMAAKLGLRAFAGDDRVVVVPTGGADKFEHVSQLSVLEALLGGEIKSLEIRDRDGRTAENRHKIMTDSPRALHVLERDSIESYLLEPEILSRVIRQLREERGREGGPSAQDVYEMCIELTDVMRDEVTDRCAQRFMLDHFVANHSYPSVTDANKTSRQFVSDHWTTLDDRLKVVSGKALLRRLRSAVQERFGVNFGNERLAEAFIAENVPEELASLLRRVDALA